MSGYNFTERTRKVLAMAREEAVRLRHEYLGTEHILLGILREGEGVASTVLQSLSIDGESVRRRLEETVRTGSQDPLTLSELPYTSRAKKVLELAMSAARELRHTYVGTEHLLLGLLAEERGIAAQVLVEAGLTLDTARAETLRIFGPGEVDEVRVPSPAGGGVVRSVTVELVLENGSILRRTLGTVDDAIRFLGSHRVEG